MASTPSAAASGRWDSPSTAPSSKRDPTALQRLRVLVIGVGSIGERHLRCFQSTGRAELGLVEIDPHLRRTVAERYGVAPSRSFPDLEAALHDPPDVAVIATPAPS